MKKETRGRKKSTNPKSRVDFWIFQAIIEKLGLDKCKQIAKTACELEFSRVVTNEISYIEHMATDDLLKYKAIFEKILDRAKKESNSITKDYAYHNLKNINEALERRNLNN